MGAERPYHVLERQHPIVRRPRLAEGAEEAKAGLGTLGGRGEIEGRPGRVLYDFVHHTHSILIVYKLALRTPYSTQADRPPAARAGHDAVEAEADLLGNLPCRCNLNPVRPVAVLGKLKHLAVIITHDARALLAPKSRNVLLDEGTGGWHRELDLNWGRRSTVIARIKVGCLVDDERPGKVDGPALQQNDDLVHKCPDTPDDGAPDSNSRVLWPALILAQVHPADRTSAAVAEDGHNRFCYRRLEPLETIKADPLLRLLNGISCAQNMAFAQ